MSSTLKDLIYRTDDGAVKVQVRFEHDDIWLGQMEMADLFQTTKQNIGLHLKNIFSERELEAESVVKESFATAADGKQNSTKYYN